MSNDKKTSKSNQAVSQEKPSPDKTLTQLKRIKGQMDGIIKMYDDERTCVDITRQVLAARNSLGTVARSLLVDEASRCSRSRRVGDLDDIIKELFKY